LHNTILKGLLIIYHLTTIYFLNTIVTQTGICTPIQIITILAGIYEELQTKRRKHKEIINLFK
jgi:hypothetical protein